MYMKTEYFESLNLLVTTGTLLFEILLVLSFIKFLVYISSVEFRKWANGVGGMTKDFVNDKLDNRIMVGIFLLSFASSVMTLVYSEYFGLVPCALCWFGRICMYPIVILSAVAIYNKEESKILKYIITFSFIGLLVSLYHHALQMFAIHGGDKLPCPTSGGDCSQISVYGYDHVTFPWMAVIIFTSFIYIYFVRNFIKKTI